MKAETRNKYLKVTVTADEVAAFKRRWPCSGLPDDTEIEFLFEPNGDLVGILPDSESFDGQALVALSQDAREKGKAIEYIRQVIEDGYPCRYGHYHCAAFDRGPCSDEMAGQYNITDEEI